MMVVAGLVLFLGTNLDNALVLIAAGAGRPEARRSVALAVCIAGLLVLGAGLVLAEAIDGLPPLPLNLLGLVPLSLGVWALWNVRNDQQTAVSAGGLLPLVMLVLSNSADTLTTLVSFLAERPDPVRLPVSGGYGLGVAFLAIGISAMLERVRPNGPLAGKAVWVGPLVMIGFGLFILADTPGDRL